MCLITKCGCHIEIAKEDIVTFKDVIERENNCWEPICQGRELYEYNKVLTARKYPYTPTDTIKHLRVLHGNELYEGFHSNVQKVYSDQKICIIPKGSEMCYGDTNDVVSLHIIVFKNRLCYLKYRIAKLFKKKV